MRPTIMYVADLHLDNRNPDVTGDDGKYLRQSEAERMSDAIVAVAENTLPDMVVLAGDLAHMKNPRPWAYVLIGSLVERLRQVQSRPLVVGFRGNHDGSDIIARREFGESAGLDAYPREPQVIELKGERVLLLPWFGRANLAAKAGHTMNVAEQHAYMRDAIERVIALNSPTVVVTHFTIAGAHYSSEAQPLLGEAGEFMLSHSLFRSATELRYVVSGHIHEPQMLGGDPPMYYPGSTIVNDFGEHHAPSVLVDDGSDVYFVDLDYENLRFVTLSPEVDDEGVVTGFAPESASGAVVRIKTTVPSGPAGTHAVGRMLIELQEQHPLYIARSVLATRRHDARVAHTMTTEQTPGEALAAYFALVGGEFEERAARLTSLHHEIEEAVR